MDEQLVRRDDLGKGQATPGPRPQTVQLPLATRNGRDRLGETQKSFRGLCQDSRRQSRHGTVDEHHRWFSRNGRG